MEVEYGQIEDYKPKQGYGYITRTFKNRTLKGKKDVYFHIKTIKYNFPDLAKQLDNGLNTGVHFWYVFDTNERGAEAIRIWLDANNIPDQYRRDLIIFVEKIRASKKALPSELEQITVELAGESRKKELKKSYADTKSKYYSRLKMIQEMDCKRSKYKYKKSIKDVYDGLPEDLVNKLFWVKKKYQTNLLSHMSGGSDVVIEYLNEEVLGWLMDTSG